MNAIGSFLSVTLIAGIAVGCTRSSPPPVATAENADAWVGRWNGPEGTYLHVAGANGVYEITIMDLDSARTFKGLAAGDRIDFERDGTKESLRSTDGNGTGMKWLAGKADCLTVKTGEGYCRD
jgi:hypothetical protein